MVAMSVRALVATALAASVVSTGASAPHVDLLSRGRRPGDEKGGGAPVTHVKTAAVDACSVKLEEAEKFLAHAAEVARGSVSNGTGAHASHLAETVLRDREEADKARLTSIAKLNATLSTLSSKARREEDALSSSMHSVVADITAIKRLKATWGAEKREETSTRHEVLTKAVGDAKKELDDLQSRTGSWRKEEKDVESLEGRVRGAQQAFNARRLTQDSAATGLAEALGSAATHSEAVAAFTGRVVSVIWRQRAAVEELRKKRRELPVPGRRKAIDSVVTEVAALERLRTSALENRSSAITLLSDDVTALGEASPPGITAFLKSSTSAFEAVEVALGEAQARLDRCANSTMVVIHAVDVQHQHVQAQLKRISKYRQQGVINPLDPHAVKTFGKQVFPGGPRTTMMNSASRSRARAGADEATSDDGMEDKLTNELHVLKNLYAENQKEEGQKEEASQDVKLLNKHAEALPDEVADAVRRLAKELNDVE